MQVSYPMARGQIRQVIFEIAGGRVRLNYVQDGVRLVGRTESQSRPVSIVCVCTL